MNIQKQENGLLNVAIDWHELKELRTALNIASQFQSKHASEAASDYDRNERQKLADRFIDLMAQIDNA